MQILAWYHEKKDSKVFKSSLLRGTKMSLSEEAQTNVLLVVGYYVLPQQDKMMLKSFQHCFLIY